MKDSVTLGDAREWLHRNVNSGVRCPCCKQFAKVYKRQIHSAMAQLLIHMYKYSKRQFVHVPTLFGQKKQPINTPVNTGDFCKLAYWKLIQEAPDSREDGGRVGWWRVTRDGAAFVRQEVEVPKYALIYNAELLGFDRSKWVDIQDCLGQRFDLRELMQQ